MTRNLKLLRIRQLDRALQPLRHAREVMRPRFGWIKELRQALGMTSVQLARRMQIGQSSLSEIEASEAEGTVTLNTLRKAASALDCELMYIFVPHRPLEEILTDRIRRRAIEQVSRVNHTMSLEDQAPSSEYESEQVQELVRSMMDKPPRTLWD